MTKFALKIYEYMTKHKTLCLLSFVALTSLLFALMLRLNFNEDISAFLPIDNQQRRCMEIYQDISGADKILAIFEYTDHNLNDPDVMIDAIADFEDKIADSKAAGMIKNLTTQFDIDKLSEITDFAYKNIPLFMSEADYARIDSLLSIPQYIDSRLDEDKQLLMFPTSGILSENLQKDPLNLFSPTVGLLNRGQANNVELYDGYIFTSDMQKAIAMMESPYGNSETQNNAILAGLLNDIAQSVNAANPAVKVHYIGGPIIAVGNANRIKTDSILAIAIALVLIVAFLAYVFRNFMNLLLIVISVSWGGIFALGMISIVNSDVSLIVVGISSIILGIAVNYPLHLIAHISHTSSIRQLLKEIVTPLVIGNITTVGAFLALVPIKATALRDLGIFSAFILVGTILFVIVYLPHITISKKTHDVKLPLINKLCDTRIENNRWLIIAVAILTIVLAYCSRYTQFDANMSHINYLTDCQKDDMEYFKTVTSGEIPNHTAVYVVSEGRSFDEAADLGLVTSLEINDLCKKYSASYNPGVHRFLPSHAEQQQKIACWNKFVKKNKSLLTEDFTSRAITAGFTPDAFDEFQQILSKEYTSLDFDELGILATIFSGNISDHAENGKMRIVDMVNVATDKVDDFKSDIEKLPGGIYCFDVESMNSSLARGLSDNFNYIGWSCGFIVFVFLWFSFASIELALLSFLPMAVSWIWIMGIMGLMDIRFNIVNIILATFIFGQGDDYTIFITEGCCYEYAYRKRMLASFKRSIIISAIIMFVGIGSLIFAKHPALHSLAEVTIIGMLSVVLMAYLLPPFVFNWITKSKGHYRLRPLTLPSVMRTLFCGTWWFGQLVCGYVIGFFLFGIGGRNWTTLSIFHRFVTWCHRLDIKLVPGIRFHLHNPNNEQLQKPCIIVSNHQSILDPWFFMAWSPKILIVANERSSLNPIVRVMFKWLGFYTIKQSNFTAWKDSTLERDLLCFKQYIDQGYSIVFFPEGIRNPSSNILRCHKGAFFLARKLEVDVLPVLLHGVNNIMPIKSFACYSGEINMCIGNRITPHSDLYSSDYSTMTKLVQRHLIDIYSELKHKYETAGYFAPLVIDRYKYKGADLIHTVKRNLNENNYYSSIIDREHHGEVIVLNSDYGQMPLLLALAHPNIHVLAYECDEDKRLIAKYAAEGLVSNVEYLPLNEFSNQTFDEIYDLSQS